jgi:sigma-B regulation protein RsbU (phosphoserine phosphatase)
MDGSSRLSPTGLVLGVAHDWTYSTGSVETEPGDRLVWFTDGITEAVAADGEEFGDDRIIEILQQHRAAPADALVRTLSDAVSAWTETGRRTTRR